MKTRNWQYNYNVSETRYVLSSPAKPGQSVAECARFVTTGC
jgi:hypothetical protein